MPHTFLQPTSKKEEGKTTIVPPGASATPKVDIARKDIARQKRSRNIGSFVFLVFLLIIFWVGSAGATAYSAIKGRENVLAAQKALVDQDFVGVSQNLKSAERNFRIANITIQPLRVFELVPRLGQQVSAVSHLISAAKETTVAINTVSEVMLDVLQIEGTDFTTEDFLPTVGSLSTLSREEKRSMLAKLDEAGPKIREVDSKVQKALSEFDQVPTEGLIAPLADAIEPLRGRLEQTREMLLPLLPIAESLPALVGYPEKKSYLFLTLNNTELRPGGGFIGSFGIMHVEDGELLSFETEDIYALDGPAQGKMNTVPPEPFREFLGVQNWFVRDANWSPDFRRSSEQVLALYDRERTVGRTDLPPVDGVIAITPDIAADLMRITGPVTVDGVTFSSGNLVDVLQFEVHQAFLEKGIPEERRKDIMAKLIQEVLSELLNLPTHRWGEGVKVAQESFAKKHLMLYSRDPDLQEKFERNGWAGQMLETDGDYMRWVDANLGALKTDSVMKRSLGYTFSIDGDGEVIATANMTYSNTGGFTFKTTRYRTYTRVYAPLGSELIRVDGSLANDSQRNPTLAPDDPESGEEDGKTWFGAFTAVNPGETRTLSFTYRLPENVKNMVKQGDYSLVVQKQLGTGEIPLSLNLDFGKELTFGQPSEMVAELSDTRYRLDTDLEVDRGFLVKTR